MQADVLSQLHSPVLAPWLVSAHHASPGGCQQQELAGWGPAAPPAAAGRGAVPPAGQPRCQLLGEQPEGMETFIPAAASPLHELQAYLQWSSAREAASASPGAPSPAASVPQPLHWVQPGRGDEQPAAKRRLRMAPGRLQLRRQREEGQPSTPSPVATAAVALPGPQKRRAGAAGRSPGSTQGQAVEPAAEQFASLAVLAEMAHREQSALAEVGHQEQVVSTADGWQCGVRPPPTGRPPRPPLPKHRLRHRAHSAAPHPLGLQQQPAPSPARRSAAAAGAPLSPQVAAQLLAMRTQLSALIEQAATLQLQFFAIQLQAMRQAAEHCAQQQQQWAAAPVTAARQGLQAVPGAGVAQWS